MSDKLARAKARGAKVEIIPKYVRVEGIEEVLSETRVLIQMQQQSQIEMIEMFNQMLAALNEKDIKSPVIDRLAESIAMMVDQVANPMRVVSPLVDYSVDFERDSRTNLMKPGTVRFIAQPQVNKYDN